MSAFYKPQGYGSLSPYLIRTLKTPLVMAEETFSHTFATVGIFDNICAIHSATTTAEVTS